MHVCDSHAIESLIASYAHRADNRDAVGFAELFTPAAHLKMGNEVYEGREAITEWFRNAPERPPKERGQHFISSIAVNVLPGEDRATASSYLLLLGRPDGALAGTYNDEFEKTAAGWRICKRELTGIHRIDLT
jgi:SnoaL-like domain